MGIDQKANRTGFRVSASTARRLRIFFAMISGLTLGACGSIAVDESTFFANPSTYELYNCSQLAPERKTLLRRVEELKGLMNKAATGAAGSVVAEVAYRPEYLSAQSRLKSANAAWERNNCDVVSEPALGRPAKADEPASGRSTGRVY